MYKYTNNLKISKTSKKIIRNFESSIKVKILKKYDLENVKSDKIEFYQIVNEYFYYDIKIAYLLIYHYIYKTKNFHYRIIKIDREDVERLKKKIWRIQGNEIFYYKLNSKSLKKINHISLKSYLTKLSNVEFSIKSDDKNDYRKENIFIRRGLKRRIIPNKSINKYLIDRFRINSPNNQMINNLNEFEKKYKKILIKNNNYYYQFNNSTIALVIIQNNNNYLSFIDQIFLKLVSNYIWKIHNHGGKNSRKPKHLRYLITRIGNMEINMQNYVYFNGNLEEIQYKIKIDKMIVDHINHNPLDNRFENLRLVNITENNRNQITRRNNTSGITGVRFDRLKNRWIAQRDIYFNGRFSNPKSRGLKFLTFEDAVLARKKLELISDKDFLSNILTYQLFEKYEKEGKFKDLIK